MSAAIKKVTLAGASGNLGPAILNALVSSNLFNVTVLTRESSKNTFPSGVTVKAVDYSSQESLASALSGQDALISTLGSLALAKQETLIDAAISAGVKRFIPSEFGSDTFNGKAQKLPVYKGKIDTQAILADRASKGSISYTTIINGPFLDWGVAVGFLGDLKSKKPELVDGGDVKFSSTTVDNIGQAVVGVLSHPEETKNRAVYVKNCDVSQNELIGIAKTVLGEDGWAPTNVKSEQLEGEAWADLKAHKYAGDLWVKFIRRAIYGEGFGNVFEAKDNSLLGVPEFGKADLEKVVKDVLEGKGSAKNFTSD